MSPLLRTSKHCTRNCGPNTDRVIPAGKADLECCRSVDDLGLGRVARLTDKAKVYFYVQTYHRQEFPTLGAYSKFVEATNRYSEELRALLALRLYHPAKTCAISPRSFNSRVSNCASEWRS
jgi:hypothetical protein